MTAKTWLDTCNLQNEPNTPWQHRPYFTQRIYTFLQQYVHLLLVIMKDSPSLYNVERMK